MKLSYQWIADAVDLPEGVDEMARRLTSAGLAVEGQEEVGDDIALDIDITTNRPDCMNHLGMAREVAVLFGRTLTRPVAELQTGGAPSADEVTVEIDDPTQCRRYVAWVVRGVKVGPSPRWITERLELLGVRSVNNVVDVTNYVLWECGQPLHAFDLAKLRRESPAQGSDSPPVKIVVRQAREGETLTTLDVEERTLRSDMLLIADGGGPVALAGVMGGADSEVSESTVDVLLESAYFDPRPVRRTASGLSMHSDASHRFERGADPELCEWAARRAAALLAQVAGGTAAPAPVDAYPAPFEPHRLELSQRRLERFTGARFDTEQVEAWFRGLGFGIERREASDVDVDAGTLWNVTAPTWRHLDIERVEDLYEEVVRLYGYDAIESTLPALAGHDGHTAPTHTRAMAVRRHLAACGLSETVHFAFHDAETDRRYAGVFLDAAAGPTEDAVELLNPLSDLYRVMRRSLLPGLVGAARYNQRRGASAIEIFEIGHVFRALSGASDETGLPVDERETVALAVGGVVGNDWQSEHELDFFDLKGALESLAGAFSVALEVRPAETPRPELVPGVAAELVVGSKVVGYAGRLLEENDLTFPLFVAELETAALATTIDTEAGAGASLRVEPPSRFPGVEADLTFTHAVEVSFAAVREALDELAPENLVDVHLVSRYQGKGVPDGAVNTTLRFHYSSAEGSLTQEGINERQSAVQHELNRRFGWGEERT